VGPLRLDEAGDEAVSAWLATHPDVEAIARVAELLDDVSHRRALSPNWFVTRDPVVASDRLVEVLTGLVVVIRIYSDEDPEEMFSVVRIVSATNLRR
jgi:hypothetical protein